MEEERGEEREENSGPHQLDQDIVPGAEENIADMTSLSMQDVQMQPMLPEQRDEKQLLHVEAQQRKEEGERERGGEEQARHP